MATERERELLEAIKAVYQNALDLRVKGMNLYRKNEIVGRCFAALSKVKGGQFVVAIDTLCGLSAVSDGEGKPSLFATEAEAEAEITDNNATRESEGIVRDFSLWGEYVDPYGTMSESEFDAMGIDERRALMAAAFPECMDVNEDESVLSLDEWRSRGGRIQ